MDQQPQKLVTLVTKVLLWCRDIVIDLRYRVRRLFQNRKHNVFIPEAHQFQEFPRDPLAKFLRQSIAVALVLLVLTSFSPGTLLDIGASVLLASDQDDGTDFLETEGGGEGLFLTEDIYLRKEESVDIEKDANYYEGLEVIQYTVESGDTLSGIASRHGINVTTIVAANDMFADQSLRVGQILIIPPQVGVFYVVQGGDTWNGIANKFKVSAETVQNHNKKIVALKKGDKLFVPGAKPLHPPQAIARDGSRKNRLVVNTFESRPPTIVAQSGGDGCIKPTVGSTSRGFSGGHGGWDIANRSKPDVWTSCSGTVLKIEGGCPTREQGKDLNCNHRYGNNVLILHENGWQTRYAHLEKIYVVPGQSLEAGQIIGLMGNTGWSLGATGIHLHFEAIDSKGARRNPAGFIDQF